MENLLSQPQSSDSSAPRGQRAVGLDLLGRRDKESGYEPAGGWARLERIQAGTWGKYHPRRGLGLVQRFMEKEGQPGDKNRPSHWFDVPQDYALSCLVLGEGENRRVYVVTTDPPPEYAWIHDRWPLICSVRKDIAEAN